VRNLTQIDVAEMKKQRRIFGFYDKKYKIKFLFYFSKFDCNFSRNLPTAANFTLLQQCKSREFVQDEADARHAHEFGKI
jgi:hypothetical protein